MFKETGLVQNGDSHGYVMPGVYKIRVEVEKRIVVHYTGSGTGAGGLDQRFWQHHSNSDRLRLQLYVMKNEAAFYTSTKFAPIQTLRTRFTS